MKAYIWLGFCVVAIAAVLVMYTGLEKEIEKTISEKSEAKQIPSQEEIAVQRDKWVAGETIDEMIKKAKEYNAKGVRTIINRLGEHESSEKAIADQQKGYLDILDKFVEEKIDGYISIKPTSLGLEMGLDEFIKNVDPILKKSSKHNIEACLDLEDVRFHKQTYEAHTILLKKYPPLKLAVQVDMLSSVDVAKKAIETKGGSVRLVRGGIYAAEDKSQRFKTKQEVEDNFVKAACMVMKGKRISAVATHSLIDRILKECPSTHLEFEVLYGEYGDKVLSSLTEKGVTKRTVYIPFGPNWLGYCSRRDKWFLQLMK